VLQKSKTASYGQPVHYYYKSVIIKVNVPEKAVTLHANIVMKADL
jgi:hypothetical protein